MMSREHALEVFVAAARAMWANAGFALQGLELSHEEPAGGALATLAYEGRPFVLDRSILRRPPRYVLRVSSRLLAMTEEALRKIMVHEAAHLGYADHGDAFRRLVRAHGGSVSEAAIEADVVRVEVKIGSRYQLLREFPGEQEDEAVQFAKEQHQLHPLRRYRISQ